MIGKVIAFILITAAALFFLVVANIYIFPREVEWLSTLGDGYARLEGRTKLDPYSTGDLAICFLLVIIWVAESLLIFIMRLLQQLMIFACSLTGQTFPERPIHSEMKVWHLGVIIPLWLLSIAICVRYVAPVAS